jgi:adenylate cyclase
VTAPGEPAERGWVSGFLDRLSARAVTPGDDEDERIRKITLTRISAVVLVVATVWVVMYLLLGQPLAAAIPFAYQVINLASLSYFLRTKRFSVLRTVQLSSILVGPYLLQWALGGFVVSGAVMVWAFLAPLGALVFSGSGAAVRWFVAYVGLLVLSGVIEGPLGRPADIPLWVQLTFFVMNIGTLSAICFYLFHYFIGSRNKARAALVAEQARSERLLLNILPETIAERLKRGEEVIADGFDEVSVMFADLVGFTPLAGRLDADEIISLLNDIFTRWDALADHFGLEKIKTIGDSYMVVAGVPIPRSDHAAVVTDMAIRMLKECSDLPYSIEARVGIATGPVVAGVIGKRKFSYDVWGDTVNLASRLESHGVPGRVCVSERTYEQLKDRYAFEERAVEIKGKGRMRTFLLTSELPAARTL